MVQREAMFPLARWQGASLVDEEHSDAKWGQTGWRIQATSRAKPNRAGQTIQGGTSMRRGSFDVKLFDLKLFDVLFLNSPSGGGSAGKISAGKFPFTGLGRPD